MTENTFQSTAIDYIHEDADNQALERQSSTKCLNAQHGLADGAATQYSAQLYHENQKQGAETER